MYNEEEVKKVLAAALIPLGYTLVSAHYQIGPDGPTLAVVVDREAPISLDDIVKVSEPLSAALDEHDPISGPYTLDVSSLGAEKPIRLEDLEKYAGRYVNLHLSHPYKGENILEGTLQEVQTDELTLARNLKGRIQKIQLPRQDVDKARLAIKF